MNKCATIDIGTNSMRLLLIELEGKKVVSREKTINVTRIGASVDGCGYITPQGIDRNLQSYNQLVQKAEEWGAESIWSIATSAVRDAKNGEEFTQIAFQETGVPIKIITGEEEAELGYKGVLWGIETKPQTMMVIDIGGGSTELIVGNATEIIKKSSIDIGAVRMTERYITTDPISEEEYLRLKEEINKALDGFFSSTSLPNIEVFVGIGGTATSLGAIDQQLVEYDMDKIHTYRLKEDKIHRIMENLKTITLEEKKKLKGLHPKRADIILAGTVILHQLMKKFSFKEMILSEYDNLEGLLITQQYK
ncbi:Ppx/GppA phosphatase family protein [Alkaliphilus serpentinus]|uniref:Ppx/GppA family phosphatase n=1 Tax=Alkaliphilus serpentinus TaxID=1482731 RepID=A0A833HQH5_9FIRM|nr:Ppx/GppA phosphatase family protein [Alkaliphilus serpentinus]KAB3531859.1 Ppx/GppA family phosphatase [Alkaliphilus serpentinus]